MKKTTKLNKSQRGFTFIEVMMGLLIFSIIALSLYSTFSAAISAWEKAEDANRVYQEAKWALDEIAHSLKNAAFFDFSQNYPDLKLFKGEENKISFLIADESGLKRISYFLEKPDFGNIQRVILGKRGSVPEKIIADYKEIQGRIFTLRKSEQDFLKSLAGEKDSVSSDNLTSLVKEGGLNFSFAYKTTESESLETLVWKESFESPNEIPRLVKITLTLLNPQNLKQEKTFTKIVFIPTGTLPTAE
jgi:prepilin-type N-terminal cleavage/methylation domain-containing protein